MKKFFTLIAAVASAVTTAFAGNELVNADFAEGVMGDVNIATYASDGAVNHLQEVPGWTIAVENIDARAAGVAAYGSGTSFGGNYYAPAAGPEGTNGNCLGMVAVWNGSAQYTQDVTLPAGAYTMTVPVCNTAGTSAFVKNLIGVKYGATEKYATTVLYPVNTWKTEVITFELAEETTVTVSLGYNGANVGSSASQHLFIDCVKLETISALDLAKTEALKALPVSNGTIFTPAAADIEAVKAAIEAATTVEEVAAAVPAEWNIPALKGNYYVKNTNGEAYLSEAKLSAEPVAIKFEKAEGGFYINVNGNYLNMKGGDTWSMTATDTPVAVWNFNLNDGKYTIQGPNGLIGSDNINDGSATYGNKKITETGKNIFWTVENAPEMSEYTVYAKVSADGQSKTFVGQVLKVATLNGVATVTLPAAQAGPYTMESQKVQVNISEEGAISMIEGQTLNFKMGETPIVVTVTSVAGALAEGKVNVTVLASGDNGKDVKVIYSTDEIKNPITTARNWNFMDGTAVTPNTDNWGATDSKGRTSLQNSLTDELLPNSTFGGIYFTVANGAVYGITNNYCLQSGSIIVRIPQCAKGDQIKIQFASAGGTATVTSDNIDEEEGLSTTATKAGNYGTVTVSEEGDVVLTMKCSKGFRLYSIDITPYDPTDAPVVKSSEKVAEKKVIKYFKDGKVIIGNVNAAGQLIK